MITPNLFSDREPLTDSANALLFKRVLLVESDPRFIQQIREFLDSHFFDVTVAESPVEAVKELIKADYDVIVCDLTTPNFPGEMFFKAVERVRAELCRRFISITDSSQASRRQSLGVLSIWKPLDLQILLQAIRTVLKKNHQTPAGPWASRAPLPQATPNPSAVNQETAPKLAS